jgi:predicted nucleotidyltransferase
MEGDRDRAGFSSVADFARDIRGEMARHLAPAEVSFRGSLAEGTHDEYSDVDLLARVSSELDGGFFSALEKRLVDLYGPALVRYDPYHVGNLDSQHVRFSFYELPVFWRVDLEIASDKATAEKWPSPFPEWSVGTSALMNVVWAIKYRARGDVPSADHYLASACDKLGEARLRYSVENVRWILDHLRSTGDADAVLVARTREAVRYAGSY